MPADLIPSVKYSQFIPSCTMSASKALELSEAAYLASSNGGGGVRDWGNLTVNANCCRRYGPTVQTNASPGPGLCLYEGTIAICDGATAAATKTFSSDSAAHSCPAERRTWLLSFPDDETNTHTASHTGSGSFSDPTHWTATATGTYSDGEGGGGSYSLAITGLGNSSSGTFTGTVSGALTGTLSGTYGGGSSSTIYVLTAPAPPFPITVSGTGSFTAGVPPNFTIAGSLTFPPRSDWEQATVEFTVDGGSGGTVNVTIADIGDPGSFVTGANAIATQIAAFAGWNAPDIEVQPLWNGLTVVTGRPPIARQIQVTFKSNFPTSLTPVDFDILDADGNYHSYSVLTGPTITGGGSPVDLYTWVEFAGCDAEEITVECRRDSDDFVYARWTNTGHIMQSGARTILTLVHEACEGPCGEVRGFAKKVICFEPTISMPRCGPNGWNPAYAMVEYDGEFGGDTGPWQLIPALGTSPASTGFTGGPYSIELTGNPGWTCDRTATLVIDDTRNIWSVSGGPFCLVTNAFGQTVRTGLRCPNNITGVAIDALAEYGFAVTSSWSISGLPGKIGTLTIENINAGCAPTVYDVSGFTFVQTADPLNLAGWPCSPLDFVFSGLGVLRVTRALNQSLPFISQFSFDAAPELTVTSYPNFFPVSV